MFAVSASAVSLVLAVAVVALWCLSGGDPVKVYKPGREEELLRMDAKTGEETRRYTRQDGKEVKLEIVFQDGCVGVREKSPAGVTIAMSEQHKDGTRTVYDLDDKGTATGVTILRKDKKKLMQETLLSEGIRNLFREDGETLLASLLVTKNRTVVTLYDEQGRKRYEEVDEQMEGFGDMSGEEGEGGGSRTSITYIVYNGATTPVYRLTMEEIWDDEEGGRSGQPDNDLKVAMMEEFHEGSWKVSRRIIPGRTILGSQYITVTEVAVLSDGKEQFVRYLDDQMRIIHMVDKTKTPEVKLDIDAKTAAKEEIDQTRLKSPATEADIKVMEQVMQGPTDSHLQRLLVK